MAKETKRSCCKTNKRNLWREGTWRKGSVLAELWVLGMLLLGKCWCSGPEYTFNYKFQLKASNDLLLSVDLLWASMGWCLQMLLCTPLLYWARIYLPSPPCVCNQPGVLLLSAHLKSTKNFIWLCYMSRGQPFPALLVVSNFLKVGTSTSLSIKSHSNCPCC